MISKCLALLSRRVLKPDPELVRLPAGVGRCTVYRNAFTLDEQERIHEEWSRVMEKEGEEHVLGSSQENKVVKNTYLEVYGESDFTEVKSNQKKEVRRLPGLIWSPTMMKVVRDAHVELKTIMPDMGRVVEHNLPGYEMHIEHPTVGLSFLYINLLSDTVLHFDDESSSRTGEVLLPAGSIMEVGGELRWGFRFGERAEEVHTFHTSSGAKRRVETDLRLSVQLWRLTPGLLDCRVLQDRMEESLNMVEQELDKKPEMDAAGEREKLRDTREAIKALGRLEAPVPQETDIQNSTHFVATSFASDNSGSPGVGLLGGDLLNANRDADSLSAEKLMKGVKGDFQVHKSQFTKIQSVLEEMKGLQSKGQPVNDMWMKKKITENSVMDAERDAREGYDPNDVEGSWDKLDAKAKFYKTKLKTMDYDGTAFLHSRMPDVSQDAPLDMRATIAKIAPHVRDGDKVLQNLPQSH